MPVLGSRPQVITLFEVSQQPAVGKQFFIAGVDTWRSRRRHHPSRPTIVRSIRSSN
jgi:hypothetical protein